MTSELLLRSNHGNASHSRGKSHAAREQGDPIPGGQTDMGWLDSSWLAYFRFPEAGCFLDAVTGFRATLGEGCRRDAGDP